MFRKLFKSLQVGRVLVPEKNFVMDRGGNLMVPEVLNFIIWVRRLKKNDLSLKKNVNSPICMYSDS